MKKLLLAAIIVTLYSCKNDSTDKLDKINESIDKQSVAINKNTNQAEVLTLGSFHFNFPNLDVVQTAEEDQIDVLEPKFQEEIELIVDKLEKFKPTKIIIERRPEYQQHYDSLYTSYVNGIHELKRNEEQQIGFRLAKRLGLDRLYCVDAWGKYYDEIQKTVFEDHDTIAKNKFMDYFYNNPDTLLYTSSNDERLYKTEGILAELKRINEPVKLKESLGDYFVGIFKYETDEDDQFGPDFVTGWWFNRNLRIFRNIQRIDTSPEDRILIIYGSGHMNLLNIFFESSPEYTLLNVNDYLN